MLKSVMGWYSVLFLLVVEYWALSANTSLKDDKQRIQEGWRAGTLQRVASKVEWPELHTVCNRAMPLFDIRRLGVVVPWA